MAAILMLLGGSGCQGAVPSSERSRAAVKRVEPGLTEALSKQGLKLGAPVFIRIFKDPGVLEVWVGKGDTFQLFKTYKICAWSGSLGPKLQEGDNQAPEGCYFVKPSQMNPNSSYHLSFNLGYPNAYDKHHQRTGNALMVHGNCASIGCYAMGDDAIEEIWTLCVRALEGGQPFFRVHCFPFPLTAANLEKHKESRWIGFWRELQPVYEHFEKNRIPPNVEVKDGRYVVDERTR
jgi:murein L,D-transpeptidase YafK